MASGANLVVKSMIKAANNRSAKAAAKATQVAAAKDSRSCSNHYNTITATAAATHTRTARAHSATAISH